jgi:hypothetical protein
VSCFGTTRGVDWVVAGATVTIVLSEGDATECIYYYRLPSGIVIPPVPPFPPLAGATPIPLLDPRMLLMLTLVIVGCAAWAGRRR